MKFIPIASAKGIKPGEQVYTLDAEGNYGAGKLLTRTETATGTAHVFEVPQYFDENAPMIKPLHVTNITHVCSMKPRAAKPEAATDAG